MAVLRNFDDLVIEQLQDRELAAEYLNVALEEVQKDEDVEYFQHCLGLLARASKHKAVAEEKIGFPEMFGILRQAGLRVSVGQPVG
jgi:DNA-binding phage protein